MSQFGQHIAGRYVAEAITNLSGGGFFAQWAYPGIQPTFVHEGGKPVLYPTADDARKAAALQVIERLNSRYRNRDKPERYLHLTGPEVAVLVAEAGITPTFFGYLWGRSQEGVIQWFDEVQPVPHPARVLLEIFKAEPKAIDVAEAVTDSVTTVRKPRRVA